MIRKIKDRTRARFHLALSEVGAQDTWQRVVLGFALVSSDRAVVENGLGDVAGFIEAMGLASMAGDEREILTYGDVPLSGHGFREQEEPEGMDADWIPESWKAADAGGDAGQGGAGSHGRGAR